MSWRHAGSKTLRGWINYRRRKNCGFWIAECGFETGIGHGGYTKTRNPNIEIRNNFEWPKFEWPKHQTSLLRSQVLIIWEFGFWICFVLRASDFEFYFESALCFLSLTPESCPLFLLHCILQSPDYFGWIFRSYLDFSWTLILDNIDLHSSLWHPGPSLLP